MIKSVYLWQVYNWLVYKGLHSPRLKPFYFDPGVQLKVEL